MSNSSNPFVDFTNVLVGGALEWKKLDSPPPMPPQPDNATAVPTYPTQPNTVYGGPGMTAVNTGAVSSPYQTSFAGVSFDNRFLLVSGLAVGTAILLKAVK
ncbi:hypothetical protein [Microbulbifer sp. VVAC002]|uniref:hypothetical protein n=1 Tax=Microbulbifer sp. VVAC002 TaxID=3243387 RepID=UPI00403A5040